MKTAAIIPAYNEEQRIRAVLETLSGQDLLHDIIVVNDGSTDQTREVASSISGVRVVDVKRNAGKGAAIVRGCRETDADILLLLDADLLGIESRHISELLEPLLHDPDVCMTVGRFVDGRRSTNLAQKVAPTLSGQRALKRDIIDEIPDLENTGYAFEAVLTDHVKKAGMVIKEVQLKNVSQVMKEEKSGLLIGFNQRLRMYCQILYHLMIRKVKSRNHKAVQGVHVEQPKPTEGSY